jgi:hypothetical protein
MDIAVLPPNASEFDLLVPAFNNSVPKAPPGFISVGSFTVGGVDIVPGSEFSASTPLVEFRSPNYGGRLSTEASTSASLQTWIHPDTPPGPKNVIASLAGTWSTLTGGFTVTSPRPGGLTVFPTSGPREGGTAVQIYGQNFVPGAQVFFDGLPADVQTLTPAFIGVATPPNMAGPVSVQVFNPDGGMGILRGGFRYTSPPPVVSGVEPGLRTPGSPIVISGENFDPRPANVDVRLGGQRLRVVGSTASRIEALVPCGAESGSLTVSIFGQQAAAGMFAVEPPAPSANTAPATASFVDVISNGGTDITPHDRDNGAAFIDVPFPVCLFSDPFIPDDRLTIAVNGWMNLDGFPFGEFQNAPLPATTFPRPSGVPAEIPGALVAPFFDDLVFGPTGTVSTLVTGTAPGRRFIVQWSGLSVIDEFGNDLGADLDFQAVIYEGSNDIRFVYRMMDGARAGGTGATVGLQNLARDTAIQTGYNQTAVRSDMAVTYRFGSGTYSEEQTGQLVPPTPVVSDEGRRTPSTSTLAASWTLPSTTAPSRIVGFDYAIGTTPGGTDVRGFTPVEANSVTVAGLALAEGGLYYFAVRARDALGRTSEAGVSDGIEVHTGFAPATSTFPYVTSGADVFTGLAIMADEATDAVLVAIDPDGELVAGMGIRNPRTIELGAGEQWARLVDEIFGLPAFDGWIEVRSSSASLRSYVSVGARSLERVDGAAPSLPTTDFHLLHGDATAVLVNPGWTNVTATIRSVSGSNDELEVAVPARSRREVGIGRAVRITTTGPVAAVEVFGSATNLAIGSPVATTNESLVFPHAVDGGGYASRITILNAGAAPVDVSASFGAERGDLAWSPGAIPPGETIEFAIPTPELANPPLVTGAVWVDATGPISGTIDIFRDSTLVSVPAWEPRSEMVFPHVADLDGFFTGIAMTAGPAGAEVLIDIRTASGETSGHAVVTVPADGHVSRLIREFVTDFEGQNGGYIRLESDQPIWAWQIYGTLDAMASGPPL